MIKHSENRFSKYSTRQMFELVADIEAYPIFLPWCNRVEQTMRYFDEQKKLSCIIITFRLKTNFFINFSLFNNKLLPMNIGYERLLNLSFSETLMMFKFILLQYYFYEILY